MSLGTKFAPAERSSRAEIERGIRQVSTQPLLRHIIDTVPSIVVVLNKHRQIVLANRAILTLAGEADPSAVYGKRLGEALHCGHSSREAGGCGTSEFCRVCGAARATLSGLKGEAVTDEWRITRDRDPMVIEFRVWSSPTLIDGEPYTILVLQDIANENRRKALERLFFHDVLNTAGGLMGYAKLLDLAPQEQHGSLRQRLHAMASRLVEEIKAQRELTAAEQGELAVSPSSLSAIEILRVVIELYESHETAAGRHLALSPDAEEAEIRTDRTLVGRVLGNMVRNALEAAPDGGTVTLGCRARGDEIEFWVHNPGFIPRDVQLRLFQRSFSTKGVGRGLGTYSMKLITERHLGGRLEFETSEERGTTFRAIYPRTLDASPAVRPAAD